MKKIFYNTLTLIAGLTLLASCNLEKYPDTAINKEEAMESPADCYNFLTGLYASTKSLYSGIYTYSTDLMTDCYHAIKNFGNWDGEFYHYDIVASNSSVEAVWNNFYAYIGNANFLISGTNKLLESGTLSTADEATVQEYYGEACFLRALMYFKLTEYFCKAYDKSTAEATFGVPVVTEYAPTAVSSKYPHRGSLAATYAQIDKDLTEAEKFVTTAGSANSKFVNKDIVTALRARFALSAQDYTTAYEKANSLIEGQKYALVTDAEAYADGWLNDNLSETLWQPVIVDASDGGSANSYFIHNTSGADGADDPQYLPEDWVLKLYDTVSDIRYNAYFEKRTINIRGNNGDLVVLVKFPGNPKLNTSAASRYVNMPKIFRISEMYLIAAEAAYNNGNESAASAVLNDLKSARIIGWKKTSYSGTALQKEIRDERVRELFGEGFRLSDIKRWHIGFSRTAGQDPSMLQPGENYVSLSLPADSPKFVWPIPTSEMSANPQMKGEQNEGYTTE